MPNNKLLSTFIITALLFSLFLTNMSAYAASASLNPAANHYLETVTTNPPYAQNGDSMYSPGHKINWVGFFYESAAYYLYDQSVIKFDLSSISGTVTSATLKLWIVEKDNTPFVNLYGSNDDTWVEGTTATLPSQDVTIVTNDTNISLDAWKTFDVTSFVGNEVLGDKTATFVLTGNTTGTVTNDFAFYSREEEIETTLRPVLEVTYTPLPSVTSVGVPANGTYVAGQNLDFNVNFDQTVTVNTGSGTPYIPVTLNTGGTVNASYVSGSGSAALLFRYTVQSGDEDPDGIAVGVSIAANGGTLRDIAGNDAVLTLNNIGSTSSVLVDTTSPTISSGTLAADNAYIDIAFDEGIYGTGDGATALTAGNLSLTFTQNGGTATNVLISSVKKTTARWKVQPQP